MFTSRAEYRLQLREDNADARLTEQARKLGLVGDDRWKAFQIKQEAVSRETQRLRSQWVNPRNIDPSACERVLGHMIEREYNLADLLRRPGVSYQDLVSMDEERFKSVDLQSLGAFERQAVVEQIEISAKYSGYIDRQQEEVKRASHYESMLLPAQLDYSAISALSIEVRQKLQKQRPQTLGQASRISGVTPAAISLLLIHLKRQRFKGFEDQNAESTDQTSMSTP